jgi:hypothetical protein
MAGVSGSNPLTSTDLVKSEKIKVKSLVPLLFTFHYHLFAKKTGCSAVGSVRLWGGRGRKFESCHPDGDRLQSLDNQCIIKALLFSIL